jgi:hypothetical protein
MALVGWRIEGFCRVQAAKDFKTGKKCVAIVETWIKSLE